MSLWSRIREALTAPPEDEPLVSAEADRRGVHLEDVIEGLQRREQESDRVIERMEESVANSRTQYATFARVLRERLIGRFGADATLDGLDDHGFSMALSEATVETVLVLQDATVFMTEEQLVALAEDRERRAGG